MESRRFLTGSAAEIRSLLRVTMAQKVPGKQPFFAADAFFSNQRQSSIIRQKCLWHTMTKLSGHLTALPFPPAAASLSYLGRDAVVADIVFDKK